jgi:hypothetical protein
MGSPMADYRQQVKARETRPRPTMETYRIAAGLYSFLGSISLPVSSTFLSKSKVDKTDAATSVTLE